MFEFSNNSDLADWAFHNLHVNLSLGSVEVLSPPPVESLVIHGDAKIPLDCLLTLPEKEKSTPPLPINLPLPTPAQKNDAPAPSPEMQDWQIKVGSGTQLISLKRLGEWIILIGGVFFIASVYFKPLSSFFWYYRISSLFYCFLPMLFLGLIIIVIGFFVDQK